MANQLISLHVDQDDAAQRIHDHDCVGGGLEQAAKGGLDRGILVETVRRGDVPVADDDELARVVCATNELGGDVDVNQAAVLSTSDGLLRGRTCGHRLREELVGLVDSVLEDDEVELRTTDRLLTRVAKTTLGALILQEDNAVTRDDEQRMERGVGKGDTRGSQGSDAGTSQLGLPLSITGHPRPRAT
jgi:hypothetical protein